MTIAGLVGRDNELRTLDALIDGAPKQGGALVVLGEAGIGKSTLLRAAAQRARDAGLEVLETAGVESEAQLPFAGLHQLLRPVIGAADGLPTAQRSALSSAFGLDDGAAPEPFLVALAALNLLTEAATQRPVLVAVDDVQWLDQPS